MSSAENPSPVIGIVGACASGKTTLVARLRAAGFECRHIAQEHSYVDYMWQKLVHPDFLIYLEVSYPTTLSRKKLNWTIQEYEEQLRRLQHARAHADLVVDTDRYSVEEEFELIIAGLMTVGLVTPDNSQK